MSRPHVIDEATFDVSFDAADTARQQQSALSAFVRDKLLPLADEIFCDLSGDESLLKLEHLELDLGDIPFHGFQDEMERRFRAMLASALHERQHALTIVASAGKESSDTSSTFPQLRCFLETGVLGWSEFQSNGVPIDEILGLAIRNEGMVLIEFLKKSPHRATIAKRLARQFSERHLVALIDLFDEGAGFHLKRLAHAFASVEGEDAPSARSADEVITLLWERLLASYLDSDAIVLNPEQRFLNISARLATPFRERQNTVGNAPAERIASAPSDTGAKSSSAVKLSALRIVEAADSKNNLIADDPEGPMAANADVDIGADNTAFHDDVLKPIARRLQGLQGPNIVELVEEAMRIAPASLERLIRQWQAGTMQGNLVHLEGREARQLIHALVGLRHGAANRSSNDPGHSPFLGAIEAQAAQVKSVAHYYRYVLERLLREQNVDLEEAATAGGGYVADATARSNAENDTAVETGTVPASPATNHLLSLLDQALAGGDAGKLAAVWTEMHLHYADSIREAFMRHMGQARPAFRIPVGFPEFILLDLATLSGRLTAQEAAFIEGLSRHPALRRELHKERNERYWVYALGHLHAQTNLGFDRLDYLRGLPQWFANSGAEVESFLRTLEKYDDVAVLHDRLQAEALMAAARQPDVTTSQSGDLRVGAMPLRTGSREMAPSNISSGPLRAEEATEAYQRLVQRLQGKPGPDLMDAFETLMRAAPASLETLLRRLQLGEIPCDVAFLETMEAKRLLHALVKLRYPGDSEAPIQSIEERVTWAPDEGRYYRLVLQRLLSNVAWSMELFDFPTVDNVASSQIGILGDAAATRIVQRLQGQSGPSGSIAKLIERTLGESPATLEQLLRQLRSGEIDGNVDYLDLEEARQLLRAFERLDRRERDIEFLGAIDTPKLQAGKIGQDYHKLLRRLLRNDGFGASAAAIGLGESASMVGECKQLLLRLQGHAGASLAKSIEILSQTTPSSLDSLFQQMRSGEIQYDIAALDADEARQLLHAFVRLHAGTSGALLRSIEARAARAADGAHYYRSLLEQLVHRQIPKHAAAQATPRPKLEAERHRSGGSAEGIEITRDDLPPTGRLFQPMQPGEIGGDVGTRDADKVLQGARDAVPGAPEVEGGGSGNARTGGSAIADPTSSQLVPKEANPISPGQSGSADRHYQQLASRVQGRSGVSLAGSIEAIALHSPSSLERLFQEMQSGAIQNDMAALEAAEARQLFHAFVRLRMGANGALLRSVEARAARSRDAALHYRSMLKQLLLSQRTRIEAAQANIADEQTQKETAAAPGDEKPGDRTVSDSALIRIVAEGNTRHQVFTAGNPDRRAAEADVMRSMGSRESLLPAGQGAIEESGQRGEANAQPATEHQLEKTAAADSTGPMAASIGQIVRRLRGQSGPDIAVLVKLILRTVPEGRASLENLLRQLQSGEIEGQSGSLSGEEAHELLRAFILLRQQAQDNDFLQSIESHATHARDTAYYYRYLLARLWRNDILDLEVAAAGSGDIEAIDRRDEIGTVLTSTMPQEYKVELAQNAPSIERAAGGPEPGQPFDELPQDAGASQHVEDTSIDQLLLQLTQRLQGQSVPDQAHGIAAMAWDAPENASKLNRLFRQMRDGDMRGDIAYLGAEETRQLLFASVLASAREEPEELLGAIEARAARAIDPARYFLYLLDLSINHGLIAGPAPGASAADPASTAGADKEGAYPRAAQDAPPASSAILLRKTQDLETEHEPMASNEKLAQTGRPGALSDSAARASKPNEIFVANAGLVLAAPFLPHLFNMLEFTDGTKFKDQRAAECAAHLAQFAVDARCDTPEFQLTLNKLICGIAPATPMVREIRPLPRETEAVEGMLRAMIQHWSIIGNTSIAGLRESFLQRTGILRWREDGWRLKVERKTIDVLIERLPWSISIIKFPWMSLPIHVEWL